LDDLPIRESATGGNPNYIQRCESHV